MSSTFPLDPPHALAVGANLLQTHRLLLYSGRMTGRWFNVTTTRVPGPGSGGSREPVTVTEPQKDIVGVGTVTLKLSPDPWGLCPGEARGSALLLAAAGGCRHPGSGDRVRRHTDEEAPSDDGRREGGGVRADESLLRTNHGPVSIS